LGIAQTHTPNSHINGVVSMDACSPFLKTYQKDNASILNLPRRAERTHLMRRLLFVVVTVGVVFAAGVSYAQEKNAPQMPEKIRGFLDNLTGSWIDHDEDGTGKLEVRWGSGKSTLIGNGQFQGEGISSAWTVSWCWDGMSQDGIIAFVSGSSGSRFFHVEAHGKVLSTTLMEGESTGVGAGKKTSSNIRIEFKGSDQYVWQRTNIIVGGEKRPDIDVLRNRVRSSEYSSDEKEIRRLTNQWSKALLNQDAKALDRIFSDDFTLSTAGGSFRNKKEIIERVSSGDTVATLCDYSDAEVHVYGDTAITQGIGKEKGRFKGKDYSVVCRFTDVWLKRDGQWQCITAHTSEMTKKPAEEKQTAKPNGMPKKVHQFLDNLNGAWRVVSPGKGTYTLEWCAGDSTLVGAEEFQAEEMSGALTEIWQWDGVSRDGVVVSWSGLFSKGFASAEIRGKVLSKTVMEGQVNGVLAGEPFSADVRVALTGTNRFTWKRTNVVDNGKPQPDTTAVFERIKDVTREGFEEYCKLNEGAWVGKVPLRQDVPGLGKKGDMATAHYDYTIVEDGSALIGKSYWPEGTSTWYIAYDETNKQITSIGASAVFGVNRPTLHYSDRVWICEGSDTMPDGSKSKFTVIGTFSKDGNTLTVTESRTSGGETDEFIDIWHRMNK
jgi:ketosteroid isomerase-like protein